MQTRCDKYSSSFNSKWCFKFTCSMMNYEARLKSKFPGFFLGVLWTEQCEIVGDLSFEFLATLLKLHVAIDSQKCTEYSIENGAVVVCSCPLRGIRGVVRFLPAKTNQLLKFIGMCVHAITVSSVTVTVYRTLFTMNLNSWFVLGGKKPNICVHHTWCNYTADPFSILHSIHFWEVIASQFLQCCQKLKNYISLQFHIDQS